MVSAGIDGEHARAEVRQLRELIDVLRIELEEGRALLVTERQRLVAQQEAERHQAREDIEALRVQLETAVVERNAAVQEALARSADEVGQLKATLETLHYSLKAAHEDATDLRDESERAFRAEREQLYEIIAVLRVRLEKSDAG
jgi:hypothetical protein